MKDEIGDQIEILHFRALGPKNYDIVVRDYRGETPIIVDQCHIRGFHIKTELQKSKLNFQAMDKILDNLLFGNENEEGPL